MHDLFVRKPGCPPYRAATTIALQPRLITDANGTAERFRALGQVAARRSWAGRRGKGDSLDGFVTDLDDATTLAHLQNPLTDPHAAAVGDHSARLRPLAYQRTRDDSQPQPAAVHALRETYLADLPGRQRTRFNTRSRTGRLRPRFKRRFAEPDRSWRAGSSSIRASRRRLDDLSTRANRTDRTKLSSAVRTDSSSRARWA